MPRAKKEEMPEKEEKKPKVEKFSQKNFEEKVIQLAKEGMTAEKIGESLRKQGIHPAKYGKISRILKEKEMYVSPEIKRIQEKLDRITKHREKHGQDKRAMRERERVFSQLRKNRIYSETS